MLRVTRMGEQSSVVRLRVEGRISAESCGALNDICWRCIREGKAVQLDLQAVSSVTPRGLDTLRALQEYSVDLLFVPPLIGELLVPGSSVETTHEPGRRSAK